jgi:hypothetical protein
VSHSIRDKIVSGLPIAIMLSDQNFPAVLPSATGACVVVVRVEDGLLEEIENTFADRFKAFLHPHGGLGAGSVIAIGSLSHLKSKGLADYADSMVAALAGLRSRSGAGVKVAPLVNIPIGGLDGPDTVRDLLNYDCWLANQPNFCGPTLSDTRKVFWDTVCSMGSTQAAPRSGGVTLLLPMNLRNRRQTPMTAEAFEGPLPAAIPPLGPEEEARIVTAMLGELNQNFGLGLDPSPDFTRSSTPPHSLDDGRLVIIGASHMTRVADALLLAGEEVASISTPGWTPSPENLAGAAGYVTSLNLKSEDTVVIDLWSNLSYMGTDEMGLPSKCFKDNVKGGYHILGQLQAAPKPVFQKVLSEAAGLLGAAGKAKVIFVAPFPRYISAKCCPDPSHITNFGQEDLIVENLRAAENAISVVNALGNADYSVYNVTEDIGIDKDPLSMQTSTGEPAWNGVDGVHFAPAVYREVAAALAAKPAEESEATGKRLRVDSVVTGPPAKRRPTSVTPSPWVVGSSAQWRGRGGARGGPRGGTFGGRNRGRGGGRGPRGSYARYVRGRRN